MKDKRKVEGSQKSTTITNNHFEVLANINRTTDCNPTEIGRKFHLGSRKILQKIWLMVLLYLGTINN
jgi:hypothetical protein